MRAQVAIFQALHQASCVLNALRVTCLGAPPRFARLVRQEKPLPLIAQLVKTARLELTILLLALAFVVTVRAISFLCRDPWRVPFV